MSEVILSRTNGIKLNYVARVATNTKGIYRLRFSYLSQATYTQNEELN